MENLPVVLLAGNMCDARLWEGGDGVILRAIEACGHAVHRPELVEDATIDGMAARTLTSVAGPLIAIGFSMGGIVALAMADRSPGRVAALGLIDTNASADLPERAAARPRQQRDVLAGGLERVVVEELKPNYLAAGRRDDVALLALLRDMALALGPQVFVAQSEALRTRRDLSHVLDTLSPNSLIACGAEDLLCPPAWHHAMAARARTRAHVVAGAGHMLPLEEPAALADLVADWLGALARKPD